MDGYCVSDIPQPFHNSLTYILPSSFFYKLTTYELTSSSFHRSQSVRSDKCQINSFYNSLQSATDSTVLKQIGFAYYTDDEFNIKLSNSSATRIDLSVFHLNIRSLNKNQEELYSLLYSLDIEFDVIILSEVWKL
jgi:hypothetical protein